MTTFAVPTEAEASPAPGRRLEAVPEHEHDWRLVQVDYSDGSCVREFACHDCTAVWFA
jgi:hypothetical protein